MAGDTPPPETESDDPPNIRNDASDSLPTPSNVEPDDQTIKSDVGPYSESYGGCVRKVMMSNVVTLSEQHFPNTCSVYGALVSTICIMKLKKRLKSLMEMINLKESSCLVHRKIAKADSK